MRAIRGIRYEDPAVCPELVSGPEKNWSAEQSRKDAPTGGGGGVWLRTAPGGNNDLNPLLVEGVGKSSWGEKKEEARNREVSSNSAGSLV